MTYSELVKSTANIFEGDLQVPTHELYEINIANEKYEIAQALKIYNYRQWKLDQMGFQKFKTKELIKILYGSSYTNSSTSSEVTPYEYTYNHHTGQQENKWNHQTETYYAYKKYGLFHWPRKKLVWSCRMCNFTELKTEIPEGVMLKILRLQSLKLFNAFHVIDPIVPKANPVFVGTIWELPPRFVGRTGALYNTTGYVLHYFLSDWC